MRKKRKNVLKLLFLSFILSSCSHTVAVTQVEKQYPDKKYLRDCGRPQFEKEGAVFSDLVPYIKTLQSALELCNNDKAALRQWSDLP